MSAYGLEDLNQSALLSRGTVQWGMCVRSGVDIHCASAWAFEGVSQAPSKRNNPRSHPLTWDGEEEKDMVKIR